MNTGMKRGIGIAISVLVLDQLSKWWIVEHVMRPPRFIEVTPFFNLVMSWNRGVSFGMFREASDYNAIILSAIAVAIVIGLLIWLRKAEGGWVHSAIGLIIGGAIGNVIDRMRFGAVADFLDFHAFGWHWPAFNLADAGITVGAAIIILESLFAGRETPKNKQGAANRMDAEP